MKKLLVASACVIMAATSFAQKESKKFTYGIKAGVNLTHYRANYGSSSLYGYGNESVGTSTIARLNAGVFTNVAFGSGLSLQPELGFSGMGGKIDETKNLFNYLALPILLKYTFGQSGFGIYTGPQVSYLLSAKSKDGIESFSIKDGLHKIELANVTGVEYKLPGLGLVVAARYQLGVTNILKNADDGISYKNNSATFILGYSF